MMLTKNVHSTKHLNFTDTISIGLAFNTDILYSLWKFINTYYDPATYSKKTEYNSEAYNSYAHLI
jgi:hypothetical protein